ncbi:MAG: phosphate ABC transporter permease PstA [Alphaproteobacteria bacterium]|jgi:phosphate transport system permease protein|nr:phosphate ABC transporter permease PstA [Alphaproteobacteria bacterium]
MTDTVANTPAPSEAPALPVPLRRVARSDLAARGEPFVWIMGAALVAGLAMITGFLGFVIYVGALTFWPQPIAVITTTQDKVIAGEAFRSETYKPRDEQLASVSPETRAKITADLGIVERTLYRVGNYDLFGEDFVWIPSFDVKATAFPKDMYFIERLEWGPFVGRVKELDVAGSKQPMPTLAELRAAHAAAELRRTEIEQLEKIEISEINHQIDDIRLGVRRAEIEYGPGTAGAEAAKTEAAKETAKLEAQYKVLEQKVTALRQTDDAVTVTLEAVDAQTKTLPLSRLVRFYPANDLTTEDKWSIYASRWFEFITAQPREANTEGGVLPAIVGTLTMMILLSLAVAPFGVITALYLREYAKQGVFVSFIRICVNNLAGVPSIVYGVFGLGFFCYIVGGSVDQLFFAEKLPNPTFGTGGMLWASLTLALLTVPVVIVATEEALAAVPRSMREGSLACGASKWQTIARIVLPRAAPGIMTGLILAMARGAGEVAPLMIVGVVKLAPELPIDLTAPFVHFERSFMHLGFHIYDTGFQSRNSEAGRPMVFVTTLLLISIVLMLNAFAIYVRTRLKRAYQVGQF